MPVIRGATSSRPAPQLIQAFGRDLRNVTMTYLLHRSAAHRKVGLTILLMTIGCSGPNNDPREVTRLVEELQKTRSLVLHYQANGKEQRLEIQDKNQVAELLSLLQIQRIQTAETGGYAKFAPFGKVDFCNEGGHIIVTLGFFKPAVLHRMRVGQVHLATNQFEEKMCSLAFEKEGRRIDVRGTNS
jgi:hypothetical protein